MKYVLRVFGVAITLVVVVALVGLWLPSGYRVTRTIAIEAPAALIHPYVGDLTSWPLWAPWWDEDPTIVTTLGAVTEGIGAHQSWTGESGTGELTITESNPAMGIQYRLVFDETFSSVASIRYYEGTEETEVEWEMSGDVGMNPFARYVALSMDTMVGHLFEAGLAKLKRRVERGR